jgi:hypothetical protein
MPIGFKQFLLEKETAGVYVNGNGKLSIISDLMQNEFGLHFDNLSGTCLASQAIFSIAAVTGQKPQEIVDAATKNLHGGFYGLTFETLFKALNKRPLKLKSGKTLTLDLALERYDLKDAVKAVKEGQPVVAIVSSAFDSGAWEGGYSKKTGILRDLPSHSVSNGFHALLLIGYDDDQKALILRDSRSVYALKGYMKIREKTLRTSGGLENVRFIGVHVDDFKLEDTPPLSGRTSRK